MKRRIVSIITALTLCLSFCPNCAFAVELEEALTEDLSENWTEDLPEDEISEPMPLADENTKPGLELLGVEIYDGQSGEGWSYNAPVLTLENYQPAESTEDFIYVRQSSEDFEIHLKGTNSVKTSGIFFRGNVRGHTTFSGESGASLSIDGRSFGDHDVFITGAKVDITLHNTSTINQNLSIDNAEVNFHFPNPDNYLYIISGGLIVQNNSTLTIENLSGSSTCCIYTNSGLTVTDSTLNLTNSDPDGFGAITRNTANPEFKAVITNSTISAEVGASAIRCGGPAEVTASQLTNSGSFLITSMDDITVDENSIATGITRARWKSGAEVYQAHGTAVLPSDLTLAAADTFTVPDGASLGIPAGVTLTNDGTVHIHSKDSLTGTGTLAGSGNFLIDVSEDMISGTEGLVYTGEDYTDQITLEGAAVVCGVEFTADSTGWTRSIVPGIVQGAGDYTVTYTKDGKTISKTFTVAQSGTQFVEDGVAKAYLNGTPTTTFTVDDTITVIATPTATGQAPSNAAMMAASFDAPTGGQMALFVGETQVSAPVGAGADGAYTMIVKASDVLDLGNVKPNGDPITLTARFVGNDNMADAAGTVEVSITAVVKVEIGSATTYYGSVETAWAAANGKTAAVTLLADVTASAPLELTGGDVTFDGGAYTLTVRPGINKYAITVDRGKLTMQGGTIAATGTLSNGVEAAFGGTFVFTEGRVEAPTGSGIGINAAGGTVQISGGETSGYTGLWYDGNSSVQITGGIFKGTENAVALYNGKLSSLLGHTDTTRYAFYLGNAPVTEGLEGKSLPAGTYTVGVCDHTAEGVCKYQSIDGTETHQKTCLACGYTEAAANCFYSFSENIGTCPDCKDALAVSVTGTNGLIYDGSEKKPSVAVMRGETELDVSKYTVSYSDNKDAGTNTASVTVTIGSNQGTYTGKFSIGKATLTVTGATATGKVYDGSDTVAITGVAINGAVVDDDVSVNTADLTGSVSSANAGTYAEVTLPTLTLTGSKAGNYTLTQPTGAVSATVTISSLEITVTPDSGQKKEYGAADPELTYKTAPSLIGADKLTGSLAYEGEDVGIYPITQGTLAAPSGNYKLIFTTGVTFEITKPSLEKANVTVSGAYTYNGAAQVPTADEVTVTLGNTVIASNQYTISASNNVNAGLATVTISATAGGNYSGSVDGKFEIDTAPLTIKANDQTITFGGSIAEGVANATVTGLCTGDTLSVTLTASSDQVMVENKTVTPSDAVIKNASGAVVTGNYNIKYEPGTLTINKANATVTTPPGAVPSMAYTGEAQELVTAGEADFGDVLYSLTETGEYTATIPTGINAGDYTVWYKVADTDNYNGTEAKSVPVTISKVNYTGTTIASTSGKYGMTKTYELKDLLPAGFTLGTVRVSDSSSIFDGTPSASGTVLTYQLANNENNVDKTGDIIIPVTSSTNYNAFELTVTVTVTNVRVPDPTANPIHMTYTGGPVPDSSISGTAKVDGKEIEGTWRFVSGQALTDVADSGAKQVTFTPKDTTEYGSNTGTVVVTITKAAPTLSLSASPTSLPNGGTVTLTLSGLPAGGSATVTCSDEIISVTKGTGDTWTADLPAGGASYTFTATYAGDGNHNSATASCTVSVEKITPTLSLSAAPTSLSGGGTVTLTLSGLPSGGTATVTCSGGIAVTAGAGNTWTATLPNSTATYTFTASFAGNSSYHPASASCTVEAKEVIILPNPPAGDNGEELRLVMEEGISEVPEGLKNVEGLETPEKLETAMKMAITQASTSIPQANTAVYDVELLVSTDGGQTWTPASAGNFPANGKLTVTLPYPAGTDSSYRFTVVHMFTTSDFGKTPGETEVFTPNQVTNTANGIRFVVTGLSPISVGWEKTGNPSNPTTPTGPTGGGGGSNVSTYTVTVEKSEHGKVTSNRTNSASGNTVTLTVTPDSGYVLDTLTVTDSRGNEIKLTAQGNSKYTFTMPSRAVTVKATFAPLPDDVERPCDGGADCPSHGYTDLGTVGTWYHEAVDYVLRNGLMNGYTGTTFGPNDNLSRAQLAQILFNREGRPVVNYLLQFNDVPSGTWYTEAVRWAASQGIVGGYGDGRFGPNDNITREQLAVMLWRYAGSPAATDKELHFTDADQVGKWALEAMRWAVENGVISGYGNGQLAPQGLATRAQAAQILYNYLSTR